MGMAWTQIRFGILNTKKRGKSERKKMMKETEIETRKIKEKEKKR